jgi:hypothetical protein
VEEGAKIGYPGDKAVSHILRQLLVLLQLFEEDAARGEKGCIRHHGIEDPSEDDTEANTTENSQLFTRSFSTF